MPIMKCEFNKDLILFTAVYTSEYVSDLFAYQLILKVVSSTFLLVCFVYLNESTRETRKNIFYFFLKALFVLEIIKF